MRTATHPASTTMTATSRPPRAALRNLRLERLRQRQGGAAFPPADGADGEGAPVVDAEAEPACDAPPAERPVGRVEVDVPLEERLHRAGAQPQRERLPDYAIQQVQGWNVAPPLRGHG